MFIEILEYYQKKQQLSSGSDNKSTYPNQNHLK